MLWLRVIEQAWRDCHELQNTDLYKRRDAEEALVWVVRQDMDFDAVCGLASIDPTEFRNAVRKLVVAKYPQHLLLQVFARHFLSGAKQRTAKEYINAVKFCK